MTRRFISCAAALGVASLASGGVTPDFITITATNGLGSASTTIMTASVPFDTPTTQTWESGGTLVLDDNGTEIGRVGGGSRITMGQSGSGAFIISHALFFEASTSFDTEFTVTSGVLDFPIQSQVLGSGGMTVSDDIAGGAALTGTGGSGGNAAQIGLYTDFSLGAQTLFEEIAALSAPGAPGPQDANINFGPIMASPVQATDIQLNYSFLLTANDSASGTGVIAAVPEPATAGLLLLGGFALVRRR